MPNPALQLQSFSATDALRTAVMALQRAHIETASLDARLLLQHVLGVGHEQLLGGNIRLTPSQDGQYRELIEKRLQRWPIAQLTGKREFWGMTFRVTESTLDPRPDSETLVEAVLAKFRDRDAPLAILDLGTGTGCLLIALLKEFKSARGTGVDVSEAALKVAKENADGLGVRARAQFVQSCWGEKVRGRFDIVIANPPYIPTIMIDTLAPEVRDFEPRQALDGGRDGMDCYRAIMLQLSGLLADDGLALFEIGLGQRRDIEEIVTGHGFKVAGVKEDLAGIPRCVMVKKLA